MFLNESFNRVFLNLSHSKAVPIALKWNENTWHIKVGKAEFYLYGVWLSNECSLRWNELSRDPYEYKILHDNFSESKWLVSTNVCPSFVIYPTQKWDLFIILFILTFPPLAIFTLAYWFVSDCFLSVL